MTDTPKPLRYADVLRDSAAQLDALASELDALAHELALVHRPGEQRAYRTNAAALRRLAELCEECERPKPGDARTVGLACVNELRGEGTGDARTMVLSAELHAALDAIAARDTRVRELEAEVERLRGFYRSVNEALNSGDGVYRP